ncbi:cbb3-type cytochrome oxidase subunit 3 [Dankookia sp. P2]|uniref:cbb3-type cytochrome oxidase subunit 3 n=1 Tax=Dankookia sp. P2 TaxID=3423955 RepID=UPI003D664247
MDLLKLQSLLSTVWVVWFFVLFLGMLWFVLRPSKRQHYASLADIPLRDERAGTASRSRRAGGPERESGRQTFARSI